LSTPSLPAADLSFWSPKNARPSHFSDCHESMESCRSTGPPSTEATNSWTLLSTPLCSPKSSQSRSSCRDAQPFEARGDNRLTSELLARHDNLCAWQRSTGDMACPQVREVHACFLKACKQQTTPRQSLGTVSRGQSQHTVNLQRQLQPPSPMRPPRFDGGLLGLHGDSEHAIRERWHEVERQRQEGASTIRELWKKRRRASCV